MKKSCPQSAFRLKFHLPRHERAFSLYEALVTLIVVSTVAATAIPACQQLIASQRLSGAVNALVTALHLARSETIRHREKTVLCPSSDGRACRNDHVGGTVWEEGYLVYIDRNDNREFDADDLTVQVFGAAEGLYIRSSAQRDRVTYQPNGMASGSNISFTFCDRHGRSAPRAVIVSNSGRPRTSTRDANGGTIACPASV